MFVDSATPCVAITAAPCSGPGGGQPNIGARSRERRLVSTSALFRQSAAIGNSLYCGLAGRRVGARRRVN
jgi:hypothetical protein